MSKVKSGILGQDKCQLSVEVFGMINIVVEELGISYRLRELRVQSLNIHNKIELKETKILYPFRNLMVLIRQTNY